MANGLTDPVSGLDQVSVLLGGAGGSFGAATNFTVRDHPMSVAVGNFDGDSDLDLAVANSGGPNTAGTVAVLLGNGAGGFGAATNLPAGSEPESVAVGDSDPDLAVADYTFPANVYVLLGGAGGSFGAATPFPSGGGSRSVAVGDFNGDSDPDLAVGNYDSIDVSVLLGAAGGSFGAPTAFQIGLVQPSSLAVRDFDRDDDSDLVFSGTAPVITTRTVHVLLGGVRAPARRPGSPSACQSRRDLCRYPRPPSVAVGDFDGDSSAGASAR